MAQALPSVQASHPSTEQYRVSKNTDWYNPTDSTFRAVLNIDGRNKKVVVFPPKAVTQVDEQYDGAIQDVRNGQIVGGLVPRLINKSVAEPPSLHFAYDAGKQQLAEAAELADTFMRQKHVAESLAVMAGAKFAAAQQAEADDAAAKAVSVAEVKEKSNPKK